MSFAPPGVASSRFFPQKTCNLHNNFLFSLLDILAGFGSDDDSPPPLLLLFSSSSFSLGNCLSNVPLRLGIGGGVGKDRLHQVSSLNTYFAAKEGKFLHYYSMSDCFKPESIFLLRPRRLSNIPPPTFLNRRLRPSSPSTF